MNSKMVNKKMMMGKFPDLSRKKIKSWLKKENLFYCGLYLIATTVIALMFSLLSTPHLKSFVVAVPPSLEPVYGSPRELITYGRCEQVPDMRSSYSSGAHPRGTS